jgi:hypothetical protein
VVILSRYRAKRPRPEVVDNIPQLKQKEQSIYKPTDLWTVQDDLLFLKYCPSKRIKCYHAMSSFYTNFPICIILYSAIESDDRRLPTQMEISNNIADNIDGFITHVTTKPMKITTIAPLVGSRFDESVDLKGVSFRK